MNKKFLSILLIVLLIILIFITYTFIKNEGGEYNKNKSFENNLKNENIAFKINDKNYYLKDLNKGFNKALNKDFIEIYNSKDILTSNRQLFYLVLELIEMKILIEEFNDINFDEKTLTNKDLDIKNDLLLIYFNKKEISNFKAKEKSYKKNHFKIIEKEIESLGEFEGKAIELRSKKERLYEYWKKDLVEKRVKFINPKLKKLKNSYL